MNNKQLERVIKNLLNISLFSYTLRVKTGPTDELLEDNSLIPIRLKEIRSLLGFLLPSIVGSCAYILDRQLKNILLKKHFPN